MKSEILLFENLSFSGIGFEEFIGYNQYVMFRGVLNTKFTTISSIP
jgi:hypothetical protein